MVCVQIEKHLTKIWCFAYWRKCIFFIIFESLLYSSNVYIVQFPFIYLSICSVFLIHSSLLLEFFTSLIFYSRIIFTFSFDNAFIGSIDFGISLQNGPCQFPNCYLVYRNIYFVISPYSLQFQLNSFFTTCFFTVDISLKCICNSFLIIPFF